MRACTSSQCQDSVSVSPPLDPAHEPPNRKRAILSTKASAKIKTRQCQNQARTTITQQKRSCRNWQFSYKVCYPKLAVVYGDPLFGPPGFRGPEGAVLKHNHRAKRNSCHFTCSAIGGPLNWRTKRKRCCCIQFRPASHNRSQPSNQVSESAFVIESSHSPGLKVKTSMGPSWSHWIDMVLRPSNQTSTMNPFGWIQAGAPSVLRSSLGVLYSMARRSFWYVIT